MYVVETVGDDIDASIAALPAELLDGFAELRAALEVADTTCASGPACTRAARTWSAATTSVST